MPNMQTTEIQEGDQMKVGDKGNDRFKPILIGELLDNEYQKGIRAGHRAAIEEVEKMRNPFASMNMNNARINAANEWEQIRSIFLSSLKESDNGSAQE